MTQSGFCVTAPPYTVGQPVPFTAVAMENDTPLQSSEMVRTCSEGTRTFPGTVILKSSIVYLSDNTTNTYVVAFRTPPPPYLASFTTLIPAGFSKCTILLTTIFVVLLALFTTVSQWNHTLSNETDQISSASVDVSFCGMVGAVLVLIITRTFTAFRGTIY